MSSTDILFEKEKPEEAEENYIDEGKPKTCKYRGREYFVMTDMETKKCFIDVNGSRLYLDCHGKVANKQKGSESCKTSLDFRDAKKVQDYFIQNETWNYYLLFTLNYNTGRRICDILKAKWSDFFCADGEFKEYWCLTEKKTGKKKKVYINDAVKKAFRTFLRHEPDVDVVKDINEPIFKQLHGSHQGKVLSQEAYRQALIKASDAVLDYQIRSHSMRRGMGSMMLESHPNDPKAKSVLMELYNHSSEKMTNKYIGETNKLQKEYLDDLGKKYKKYVMDGEEIPFEEQNPVSVYDNAQLRHYMIYAFGKILENANETDNMKLLELYNNLLDGLEKIAQ